MKRTQYFFNTLAVTGKLKRVDGIGATQFFFINAKTWKPSVYGSHEFQQFPFCRVTRDEARKQYPAAFKA
jgi:hypothetical protein